MERDTFIISVYCLVAEIMQIIETSYNFRARGFPPQLTDAEVITIEVCAEFFKLHEDKEIYNYFKRRYLSFFPTCRHVLLLLDNRLIDGKPKSYVNLY